MDSEGKQTNVYRRNYVFRLNGFVRVLNGPRIHKSLQKMLGKKFGSIADDTILGNSFGHHGDAEGKGFEGNFCKKWYTGSCEML